jgi:RNA polymerase sigma-70 factor, ECF subfamily
MKEMSDVILLEQMARGDEEAFAEIYRRYKNVIYGFVYRMTRDAGATEDITQECFVFLIERPSQYDQHLGSLTTFLCSVARRRVLNLLRRKYRSDVQLDDQDFEWAHGDGDPLASLLSTERVEKLEEGIMRLTVDQREVLILREFHELSYGEIAAVTQTEMATVKTRLYRARQALSSILRPYVTETQEANKYHEVC